MRPMIAVSNEFISAYERLIHAAKPYFAIMAPKPAKNLKEKYPKTIFLLFDAALKYIKNPHNNALAEKITISEVVDLLRFEAEQHSMQEIPEIMDQGGALKSEISEKDLNGLYQLFHDYVVNLQTPSFTTIELLLEKDKIEMAYEEVLKLSHDNDKAKGIIKLIEYYLQHKNSEKAISLLALMPETTDRRDLVSKILNALISEQQLDRALFFSKGLTDKELREHAMHVMSLLLTKKDKLEKGLALLHEINDNDIKSYTLSLIVAILTSQGKFVDASKLALTIEDKDYLQDALNDIVKKMIRAWRMQEAKEFVAQMEGLIEKKEANKIIESSLKARLRDERITQLQKIATRIA